MLVLAVIIHSPDFFVPAAAADEIYLGFGNPLNPAAQAEDDLIGELVSNGARRVTGGNILILLAENLRRSGILHVVKPALHGNVRAGDSKIAKHQHGRVGRWSTPGFKLNVGGRTHQAERIETLRNHVEDAGVVEIVPQCAVENLQEIGAFWVRCGRLEIRNGDAHLLHAKSSTSPDPVLGKGNGARRNGQRYEQNCKRKLTKALAGYRDFKTKSNAVERRTHPAPETYVT